MVADVAQTKKHVAMWRCMDMTHGDANVFAHLCACVIRENKLPFQDNDICLYHLYITYALNPVIFRHVGLFLCFYVCR